jgi:apolipoprotein N-acyltransferase
MKNIEKLEYIGVIAFFVFFAFITILFWLASNLRNSASWYGVGLVFGILWGNSFRAIIEEFLKNRRTKQ